MNRPANKCLRGLRKRDWVNEEGTISFAAFIPDSNTARPDGYEEVSINWETDPEALDLLQGDPRKSFHGVARVSAPDIENYVEKCSNPDSIRFEQAPLDENCYHGNILFTSNLKTSTRRMLAGAIAMLARRAC